MLHYNHIRNITGYNYKNVTIQLQAGTLQYNIASQTSLGIPDTAYVCGIAARVKSYKNSPPAETFSKNGILLQNPEVAYQAFVTIKDKETLDIISSHPLYSVVDTAGQFSSNPEAGSVYYNGALIMFEPRKVGEVDWERSVIFFPKAEISNMSNDFELVIIYYDTAKELNVFPAQTDISNYSIAGYRTKQIEIILQKNRTSYSLAKNSTIGIPDNCLIVGIGLGYFGNILNTGTGSGFEIKNSSYITLKLGTTIVIDNFPVVLGNTINMNKLDKSGFNFLPIQAVRACDVDWEGSQLFISVLNNEVAGHSGIFQIYYVQPIYK